MTRESTSRIVHGQDSLRTSTLLNHYTQALAAKTPGGAPVTQLQALAEMANVVRRESIRDGLFPQLFSSSACRSACASWLCLW
jgi:hypothetical protein